jgi:hypothetical protein
LVSPMLGEVSLCLDAGFSAVHQKTVESLSCSIKSTTMFRWFGHKTNTESERRCGQVKSSLVWRLHRVYGVRGGSPQNHRVPWFLHKAKTEGSTGGDRIQARREALKRATHGMIEVLVSGGREGPVDAQPSDGELHVLTKMPL